LRCDELALLEAAAFSAPKPSVAEQGVLVKRIGLDAARATAAGWAASIGSTRPGVKPAVMAAAQDQVAACNQSLVASRMELDQTGVHPAEGGDCCIPRTNISRCLARCIRAVTISRRATCEDKQRETVESRAH